MLGSPCSPCCDQCDCSLLPADVYVEPTYRTASTARYLSTAGTIGVGFSSALLSSDVGPSHCVMTRNDAAAPFGGAGWTFDGDVYQPQPAISASPTVAVTHITARLWLYKATADASGPTVDDAGFPICMIAAMYYFERWNYLIDGEVSAYTFVTTMSGWRPLYASGTTGASPRIWPSSSGRYCFPNNVVGYGTFTGTSAFPSLTFETFSISSSGWNLTPSGGVGTAWSA